MHLAHKGKLLYSLSRQAASGLVQELADYFDELLINIVQKEVIEGRAALVL